MSLVVMRCQPLRRALCVQEEIEDASGRNYCSENFLSWPCYRFISFKKGCD
ncbi:acetyltransferase [Vibrio cholerae]|nr:acetyltransferase [Vibrio cholerae]